MAKKAAIFTAEKAKDAVTIYVRCEFTFESTGEFQSLVKKLVGDCKRAPKIKLDLADCPFVDSGCMGAMAQVHKELAARGGGLLIVNIQPRALEAMNRIRLGAIIPLKGKKK